MQSPLLASEGGGVEDVPTLSGPSHNAQEESALSRLIAESTPASALLPPAALDETTSTSTTTVIHKPASLTTALAGGLVVLQWGFVWGAYFSNSWMDSHLLVTINWQQKYLPWLDHHTDVVIQETSVFTLASNLKDDKEYGSLAGLWICSVVLPCIFMIVCPIWILTDYTVPLRHRQQLLLQQQQQQQSILQQRHWLELTIRLSFLVAFIMLFLNIAIHGLHLQWEDTDLQVHNQLRGPYLSYLLGGTCALLSVMVLRMPYLQHLQLLGYPLVQPLRRPPTVASPAPPPATRAPPAHAFRLPWLKTSASAASGDIQTTEMMERLVVESENATSSSNTHESAVSPVLPWQNVAVFQLSIVTLLLWIPALSLVQFRVLYEGLVVDLLRSKAFNVYVWQIPGLIWKTGVQAGTPKWILVLVFAILAAVVIIIPLLAHAVAVLTWKAHTAGVHANKKWRDLLWLLHPAICSIPFAAAMVVTVPSFIDIGENLDQDICTSIEKIVQNQCLISGGVRMAGCWFLLMQAVCLELLVICVLYWTSQSTTRQANVVV